MHSSEQKKYFFPANCVWNSPLFSSTLIPQTGSFVIRSPPFRDLPSSSFRLSAKLFPFSVVFQVADPVRFFLRAVVFFTEPSENSPLPVHLIPTANHPRNHDVLVARTCI